MDISNNIVILESLAIFSHSNKPKKKKEGIGYIVWYMRSSGTTITGQIIVRELQLLRKWVSLRQNMP